METSVTNHEIPESPGNDPAHPIPYLNVIDVSGYRKDGGADLAIVIASPLQGDEKSQTRLLDKIQGYLDHLHSDEFAADAGVAPTPQNTIITVYLHPESSDNIRELLKRCHSWVNSEGASLAVQILTAEQMGGT